MILLILSKFWKYTNPEKLYSIFEIEFSESKLLKIEDIKWIRICEEEEK